MRELALRLPDTPEWVETRSMLLGERAEVFGLDGTGFAALDRGARLLALQGPIESGALAAAIEALGEGTILVPGRFALQLNGWRRETAILHLREAPAQTIAGGAVRLIDPCLLPGSVPRQLRTELEYAARFSPVAAAFAGDIPVSFCYGVPTETLWDVSIDTLEAFRGRGYATLAFEYLDRLMTARGKRAVWGALESNVASRRLAARLGFVPAGEVDVYLPD